MNEQNKPTFTISLPAAVVPIKNSISRLNPLRPNMWEQDFIPCMTKPRAVYKISKKINPLNKTRHKTQKQITETFLVPGHEGHEVQDSNMPATPDIN